MCAHSSGGRLAWRSARGGVLPRGIRETQDPGRPHTTAVAATAEGCRRQKKTIFLRKNTVGGEIERPILKILVRVLCASSVRVKKATLNVN